MTEEKIPVILMDFCEESQIEGPCDKADEEAKPRQGLALWLASVFVVGQMAGSGVLSLPKALSNAGWSGIALLIFCCVNSLYAGICLGRSWSILEERYPEYREKNRYPYPAIAFRAVGIKTKYFVSFIIDVNLFGVAIVFLLLSSQLVADLVGSLSFCYWILIFALILCPLMWLGTPEDFWPAAVLALGTTITACVILIVLMAQDAVHHSSASYSPPTMARFFLAFGTILFSFGGAASFPTFQNDMKVRSDFPKAATIGFACLLLLYLPVAVMGYSIYGDVVGDNIIQSLSYSLPKRIMEGLLALHMLFAFLIVINAPEQEFEEHLGIPNAFGWKRCVLRSCMLLLIVFIAQSIPNFGNILNLVGGSATNLTASIFPCFFYYCLCSQQDPSWPQRIIPIHEKIYLVVIIICGVIGGIACTYEAINSILGASFKPPCYVNLTAAGIP